MFNYTINPLIGVGDVKFGMSAAQVSSLIGPPNESDIDEDSNEIREYRRENGMQAVYSSNDKVLVELGFGKNIVELNYDGILLFTAPDKAIYDRLLADDSNPLKLYGFIIFLELGVTLSGFFKSDNDDKAITVFKKGRWDSQKAEMKKFSL